MNTSNDMPFIKRWISALSALLNLFGKKKPRDNSEFVDTIMADVKKDDPLADEQRRVLMEMCEDVDTFYDKMAHAERSADPEKWFEEQVDSFARETIPDCTEEDIRQVRESMSRSMDDDIVLQDEIINDELGENPKKTEQ